MEVVAFQWRIQDFPQEGAATYDFANFSRKLHKIERIRMPRGGGGGGFASLALPP